MGQTEGEKEIMQTIDQVIEIKTFKQDFLLLTNVFYYFKPKKMTQQNGDGCIDYATFLFSSDYIEVKTGLTYTQP